MGAYSPQHPGESSRPGQATTQTKVQPNSSFISDAGLSIPYSARPSIPQGFQGTPWGVGTILWSTYTGMI